MTTYRLVKQLVVHPLEDGVLLEEVSHWSGPWSLIAWLTSVHSLFSDYRHNVTGPTMLLLPCLPFHGRLSGKIYPLPLHCFLSGI